MKKLSLNAKFITTSLFCLALLAVPALAVQGQALYYAAPQPRPQVPGVMSDEVRLDPLAGALYRYGVQGGASTPQSYDITKDVFTVIRGKLRQAAGLHAVLWRRGCPAGRGRGHQPFPAKPYRGRTQRHLRHGKVYR